MREITATEVQMRLDEWERVNQPKFDAWCVKMFDIVWGKTIEAMYQHTMDQDMQYHRMTDDGCPLIN